MVIIKSPNLNGGGHIVFSVDPVGVSNGIGVTLSCLHNILRTSVCFLLKQCY